MSTQTEYSRSTVIVPLPVWKRLRCITYFFHRLEQDMEAIERANEAPHTSVGLRKAVIHDLAETDGNLAEHMDMETLGMMYGEMADMLLRRYTLTPIKEEDPTDG